MKLQDLKLSEVQTIPFTDLLKICKEEESFPKEFALSTEGAVDAVVAEKEFRTKVLNYLKELRGLSYNMQPDAATKIREEAKKEADANAVVKARTEEIASDPEAAMVKMGFNSKQECVNTLTVIERDREMLRKETEELQAKKDELQNREDELKVREKHVTDKGLEVAARLKEFTLVLDRMEALKAQGIPAQ